MRGGEGGAREEGPRILPSPLPSPLSFAFPTLLSLPPFLLHIPPHSSRGGLLLTEPALLLQLPVQLPLCGIFQDQIDLLLRGERE
jgi:hypothetical protein